MLLVHLFFFLYFALVNFSLPLGVMDWLRPVIVALPGLLRCLWVIRQEWINACRHLINQTITIGDGSKPLEKTHVQMHKCNQRKMVIKHEILIKLHHTSSCLSHKCVLTCNSICIRVNYLSDVTISIFHIVFGLSILVIHF